MVRHFSGAGPQGGCPLLLPLFCQLQCPRGLCSHPAQPRERSQPWLPLVPLHTGRACNPAALPVPAQNILCSCSRDTGRLCQLDSCRLQSLLPRPLWDKVKECVAELGSLSIIPSDAGSNGRLRCTTATAFVCLVTSCFGQWSGCQRGLQGHNTAGHCPAWQGGDTLGWAALPAAPAQLSLVELNSLQRSLALLRQLGSALVSRCQAPMAEPATAAGRSFLGTGGQMASSSLDAVLR